MFKLNYDFVGFFNLRMAQNFYLQVSSWMIKMESEIKAKSTTETISSRASLFITVTTIYSNHKQSLCI